MSNQCPAQSTPLVSRARGAGQPSEGFSLIELMIVVAIIGILASAALPSYWDYTGETQASEATTLLSGLKPAVKLHWVTEGSVPGMGELGYVQTSGKYIQNITQSSPGVYEAQFKSSDVNDALQGQTVELTFNTTTERFSWTCNIPTDYQPKAC